ncbi:MAG: ATP-binding protein [Pyrinomonadaceae bacterium]
MKTLKQFLTRLARFLGLVTVPETLDQLTALARRIEPRATGEFLKLAESQKLILKDIYARARESRGQPGGETVTLFAGLNNSGKTSAAEAIAMDLHRDLYRVDSNRVISKYIGETEKNLTRLLNAAELTNAILFFDEADALFGKRSEVKDAHDRYANIEVDYLLQQLEAFKGVAIMATNSEEDTSDNFRRRIRFVIDFPYPDSDEEEDLQG